VKKETTLESCQFPHFNAELEPEERELSKIQGAEIKFSISVNESTQIKHY
jgi:hypothetical protein